jgi:hypothetical protein
VPAKKQAASRGRKTTKAKAPQTPPPIDEGKKTA